MTEEIVIKRGQIWLKMGREYRVLGLVDGYVVIRLRGACPFLVWHKDLRKDFVLKKGGE